MTARRGSIAAVCILAVFFFFPTNAYSQTSTKGTNISITVPAAPSDPVSSKSTTDVAFSGFSYPGAILTFTDNGSVIGTAPANDDGTFDVTLSTISGPSNLGIWAKDKNGLISSTSNINIYLTKRSLTEISNIAISPTIVGSRSLLNNNSTLEISGSSYPGSIVRLFINISDNEIASVTADKNGHWEYFFGTQNLSDGNYSIKANAQIEDEGAISVFSPEWEFEIRTPACSGADFNLDGRVDVSDLSIFLFYWEKPLSGGDLTNICVDLNGDGLVDVFDFSIMMYEWTG